MYTDSTFEENTLAIELRVLYGPQAGSRLALASGEYFLGQSDECNIILAGPRMVEKHALIKIDNDGVSIAAIDGKVSDAQGNEIVDTLPLTMGMPVELGGVWISIDYVDTPWPDPASVTPLASISPVAVHDTPEGSETSPDKASAKTIKKEARLRSRAKTALIISVTALGLTALCGTVLAAWLVRHGPAQTATIKVAPPVQVEVSTAHLEEIQKLVTELAGGGAVTVTVDSNNKVLVHGYVDNAERANRLSAALDMVTPVPVQHIYIESEMLDLAKNLLKERVDPNIARIMVESIANGTLTLEGAATTQSVRDDAIDLLQSAVPGIIKVESMVVLAEELPALLQEKINIAGLSRRLEVIAKEPEFILRGKMTDDEMKQWEKLLVQFDAAYGKILPIRASIGLLQKKPPIDVQTIVGGITPYVVTESGERATRGGDIRGHTLTTVRDNEVIFDGNERFKIGR